jgi:hypothetical protein
MNGWDVWQHRQDDTPISFTVEGNISIKSSLFYRCQWHVQSTWKVWQHQTGGTRQTLTSVRTGLFKRREEMTRRTRTCAWKTNQQ